MYFHRKIGPYYFQVPHAPTYTQNRILPSQVVLSLTYSTTYQLFRLRRPLIQKRVVGPHFMIISGTGEAILKWISARKPCCSIWTITSGESSACMYLGRAVKNVQLVQFPDITNLRNNIRIKKFVIVSDIPWSVRPQKLAVFEKSGNFLNFRRSLGWVPFGKHRPLNLCLKRGSF